MSAHATNEGVMTHSGLSRPAHCARSLKRASGLRIDAVKGFTLIELLIAMTLSLLVMVAISTIFVNTGRANREQAAIARMQENGRYALGRIVADLRMTGSQYCASYSNQYQQGPNHIMRPLTVLTNAGGTNGLLWGLPSRATVQPVVSATSPWPLSPRYFLQGHECTAGTCAPLMNVLGGVLPVIPAAGTANGNRADRADAITLRYLATAGTPLAEDHANGITPLITAAPITFQGGDLAMVANCGVAEVFSAAVSGNTVTPTGNINDTLREYSRRSDARVFNFSRDMRTVSYYLGIRTNADGGPNISTLVRRENNVDQQISDGVERLELLYGVDAPMIETTAGITSEVIRTHFLTAAEVQAGVSASGAALICLRRPDGLAANEPGCLWRGVHTVDVALLVNTVTDAAATETERFNFSAGAAPIVAGVPPAVLPSGLPRGRMFRKEFRTRVNLRNFTN